MRALAVLWVSLAPFTPLTAQTSSLDAFLGEWEGEGELFEAPFEGDIVFEPALAGTFVRLRFESRMDRGSGFQPVMSSEAFYDVAADGVVTGGWFDTRGVQIRLEGTVDDRFLAIVWTAPTETGRTTYTLRDDGSMEVVDEVRGAEGWREFGRAVYRRSR